MFFKTTSYEVNASALQLSFNRKSSTWHTIKTNYLKPDPEIYLILRHLKMGLRIGSPPDFVYNSSRKMFLVLYSINWPNFIASWDIRQYVYCNCLLSMLWRVRFEINLAFLIKSFFHMIKKSRQKFKYLESEKGFKVN